MNVIHLIWAELKAIVAKPHNIVVMVAVMCIPLLYAGMFLYGFWDAFGKTGQLPVAVVNQDSGAEIAGRQLHAGDDLVDNLKKDDNFKWSFVSEKKAEDGFKDNHYFMTVRIPSSFSENATTLSDQKVRPANIEYRINRDYNFISGKMADTGIKNLQTRISDAITKTYAKTMYTQIDKLTDGLADASKGANDLSGGGKSELAGLNQLKSGFKDLANGTGQLTDGSEKLTGGASELNDGLKQAADGTQQLYDKTSSSSSNIAKLADGANTLSDSLDQLNKGAEQLANGSGQLSGGSQALAENLNKYLDGLNQFQKGMQQEEQGLDQLNKQLKASKPEIDSLSSKLNQLTSGINRVNNGTNQLVNGINQLADENAGVPKLYYSTVAMQQQVNDLADRLENAQGRHPEQLVTGLVDLTQGIQSIKDQVNDPDRAAALEQIQNNISGNLQDIKNNEIEKTQQIIKTILADKDLSQNQKNNLISKIKGIQGTDQQATGTSPEKIGGNLTSLQNSLSKQTTDLTKGLDQLLSALNGVNGQPGLNSGVSQLVNGQKRLADGVVASGDKLTLQSGMNQLVNGTGQLRNSVVGLQLGAQRLQNGTNTLAEQVNASHSIEQMTGQLNQLSQGVSRLADGMGQLNQGQQSLQSNFIKLRDGEQKLSSGMQTLQSNLAKIPGASKALGNGADQIAAGNHQLNQMWPQLVGGIHSLQSGTNQLVSGSSTLATNMNTLHSGLSGLSSGQQQLSYGTNKVAGGAQQIYKGNSKLAGSLSDAHSQLAETPTDDSHAQKFSEPVRLIDSSNQAVDTFGSGFTPYFICIGLFVGALVLTLIYDLGKPAGLATAGWNIALSKYFITILMSVAQALLVDLAVLGGLGLSVDHPWTFIGFTILTSMSFMAIIQWLAGSFNNEGRFVALVILLFQLVTSGGAYSIELIPGWLQKISPILPMTYAVNGFRNIIDGGQHQMLVNNSIALLVFILVGLLLSIITFSIKFHRDQKNNKAGKLSGSPMELSN